MKKGTIVTAAFLCVLMSFPVNGTAGISSASTKIAAEQEITLLPKHLTEKVSELRDLLPELKEKALVRTKYRQTTYRYPFPTWLVRYISQQEGTFSERETKIILNEKTGEILEINRHNPAWNSLDFPSYALALEKANAFVKHIQGANLQHFRVSEDFGFHEFGHFDENKEQIQKWYTGNIHFQRLVNGIPLQNKGEVVVSVNATGDVQRYVAMPLSEQDLENMPEAGDAMTEESAKKALEKHLEMNLSYHGSTLVYEPTMHDPIDAITGNAIISTNVRKDKLEILPVEGKGRKLIALTEKDGADLLYDVFGVDVQKVRSHWSESLDEKYPPQKIKTYIWDNAQQVVFLGVDSQTGELATVSVFSEENNSNGTISEEIARQKAVAFLQKYLDPGVKEIKVEIKREATAYDKSVPDWVDREKLADSMRKMHTNSSYQYHITALHNGVEIQTETFDIGVDQSGKVVAFTRSSPTHAANLPENKPNLSPEEAKQLYVESLSFQLVYLWPSYGPDHLGIQAKKPLLAYLPTYKTGYRYVDAHSGVVSQEPDTWKIDSFFGEG